MSGHTPSSAHAVSMCGERGKEGFQMRATLTDTLSKCYC